LKHEKIYIYTSKYGEKLTLHLINEIEDLNEGQGISYSQGSALRDDVLDQDDVVVR